MPVQTVECVICGNPVTKRKSLAYKHGRACREHEQALESTRVSAKDQEEYEARDKARVNMAVQTVRFLITEHDIPIAVAKSKVLEAHDVTWNELNRALKEIPFAELHMTPEQVGHFNDILKQAADPRATVAP